MNVQSIYIYPIKSLGGISVNESYCQPRGLDLDRRMMLVDKDGRFLTQREHSTLALFKMSLLDDSFVVKFLDDSVSIPFESETFKIGKVRVWDDELDAEYMDQSYSDWFSEKIGSPVFLVRFGEASDRKKKLMIDPFVSDVSFADGYPYLFLGTASMDHLNVQLDIPLGIDRFRPNIFIETNVPHEEDHFTSFAIGSARFQNIKPCVRCIMTTINQSTTEKGKEPLRTLAKYRGVDNGVIFGTNVICSAVGKISVGDKIIPYP